MKRTDQRDPPAAPGCPAGLRFAGSPPRRDWSIAHGTARSSPWGGTGGAWRAYRRATMLLLMRQAITAPHPGLPPR